MYAMYTYVSLHVTTIFQTLAESDIHGIQSHTLHLCDYTATVPIHFVLEQSLLLLLFTIPLYPDVQGWWSGMAAVHQAQLNSEMDACLDVTMIEYVWSYGSHGGYICKRDSNWI